MQRNIPWTNSLAPGSKMRSIVQHFSEFKKNIRDQQIRKFYDQSQSSHCKNKVVTFEW